MPRITSLISICMLLSAHSLALASEVITVYKSPTCGCCSDWIEYLETNGFSVTAHDTNNMDAIKSALGVTPSLTSCHTAEVGGYVIEGHVPAREIRRLLKERPDVVGLSTPGMPMGAPGMDGPRKDPYQVLTFDDQGQVKTYATY